MAFRLIAWSSHALGAAIVGALLSRFGATTTSLVFGAWVLSVALFATLRSGLRRLDHQPGQAGPRRPFVLQAASKFRGTVAT